MAPHGGASGGKYPKAFFVTVEVAFMAVYSSPYIDWFDGRINETKWLNQNRVDLGTSF
jgi:hypothetical protein